MNASAWLLANEWIVNLSLFWIDLVIPDSSLSARILDLEQLRIFTATNAQVPIIYHQRLFFRSFVTAHDSG